MENTYNLTSRNEFYEGYAIGLNPTKIIAVAQHSEAFNSGFYSGRREYERLNGLITNGIPKNIVTKRILEEFMLSGMLGMEIDSEQYNAHQIKILLEWYQCGIEKYDPQHSSYLMSVLESRSIGIR